jgi:hypothetical protein
MIDWIVGCYGFAQIEMTNVKLINKDGSPKSTKHMSFDEQDGIAIYKWLSEKVKGIGVKELHDRAERINEMVRSLLNVEAYVNNYLLSMFMLNEYINEHGTHTEKMMILPKVMRQINAYDSLEGEKYRIIARDTFRASNNLWRQYNKRPQLSDEVRDAMFYKIKRKVAL